MYADITVKNQLLCQILMKLELSRQIFEKNNRISNFMKIRPVEDEMFHEAMQT